jgi:carbonic anhydrase
MSTSESIVNITTKNISGKCDLKCSYNFNYQTTNLTIKNNEFMISLTPENSMPSVIFNESQYSVSSMNIYSPSQHLFNNKKVSAEIQIEHIPVKGGPILYVCIPIINSGDLTSASNMLINIIKETAKNAPARNESFRLNMNNFTLQSIVPKSPFYSYTGKDENKGEFIVYGMNNAIPISQEVLTILGKIIKPYNKNIYGNSLFYNANGPNSSIKPQGIYISCQPTGTSKEETQIVNEKQGAITSFNINTFLNNLYSSTISQIIMVILVIGIILFIFSKLFHYLINKNSSNILQTLRFPNIK